MYLEIEVNKNPESKIQNLIYLPKLQPAESEFLQLVSENNVDSVARFHQDHSELNINSVNFQLFRINGDTYKNQPWCDYSGITALEIAVQNRSKAMVELLLQQPDIEIGDTVLHAIRANNITILEMLLNAQKKVSPGLEFAGTSHSTEFPGHVTPLILAAQLGHYDVIAMLMARGHTIVPPHPPYCYCIKCKRSEVNDDPLYTSSARVSVYRAISSPAYLVQVSADPILAAFLLSAELEINAELHVQLAADYLKLRDGVSTFAVELAGCCRTSEEVELLLKQKSVSVCRRQFELPRLLMAVDYKQKEFVAHPNTQQVLESHWIGDWYSWRNRSSITKVFITVTRIFITPLILLMCMITPRHRFVSHCNIPLNKLITHAGAYFVFLALVFHVSNQDKSAQKRGPPNTGAEAPLMFYVCGYTWSAVRMCLMQGTRRFFSEMWNWAELIMLGLFILTFGFWVAAAIDVATNDDVNMERKWWSQYDPTLLAEGTFCLATIFAYMRLMMFCQLNYHLGPLQVSLGKMTIDIYKYIMVFAIIISAFAAGLARFYQYYDDMVYEDEFGMKTVQVSSFTSLSDTLKTLFWALFCMAPLESADVVLENTRDVNSLEKNRENRHEYTERIGYFCFGCFEVISVIVVLNMLIATMSNTFQRVNDNVAIEWTFGRTQVYVHYMSQTILPSPYNMIPTAAGMSNVLEWLYIKLSKPSGACARWLPSCCCYIERDSEAGTQSEYPALMTVLVQRYFRSKQSAQIAGMPIDSLRRDVGRCKLEKQSNIVNNNV